MRFCSLGSGSSGNATLIEAHDGGRTTRLLVDCGFTLRELKARLAHRGLGPDDIDAVFVTHEHGDHLGCAFALRRHHSASLWASAGTWRIAGAQPCERISCARAGEPIAVGALEIMPFAVPHDAAEPLQLTISDGVSRLGLLTDLGHAPPPVLAALAACTALLLECNHDERMLAEGPYPYPLKRRVGGAQGHLANHQAAAVLAQLRHGALRHVVAAHLSRQNNRPALAAAAVGGALDCASNEVVVADAEHGSPWLDLR
jgi:phosphoribosyl 1,2-cyclic phosphodiesterase